MWRCTPDSPTSHPHQAGGLNEGEAGGVAVPVMGGLNEGGGGGGGCGSDGEGLIEGTERASGGCGSDAGTE
jgi:hypothetical protein